MKSAKDVTETQFTIDAASLASTLEDTTIRYMSGVSGDDVIVVDNDVVFSYEKEEGFFKKISSTFTINNGQKVTVSYEMRTLEDEIG